MQAPNTQAPKMLRHVIAALAATLLVVTPMARAADPVPYTVDFKMTGDLKPTGDAALDAALHDSSNLISLREVAPAGPFALVLRAQEDTARLQTALHSFGYYKAAIAVSIGGRALDAASLPDELAQAPSEPPQPVSIAIDLGPRFHVGSVKLVGAVPPDIAARVELHPGEPATAAGVLAAQAKLLVMLRDAGYALAKVDLPPATLRPQEDLLDVTFEVASGPQVDIGPIQFAGLDHMHEDFLRRHLMLQPGERFTPATIERARNDLAGLGVFSSVRAEAADHVDADGRLPVTFDVIERPLHSVDVGAAYSTDLGINLTAGWHHRNLFGNAEQLNLTGAVQLGGSAVQKPGYLANAQFIKPDFLTRDQSLEINLGAIKQSLQAYDQQALTQKLGLTRKLPPHWLVGIGLAGEEERIAQEGVSSRYNLIGVPLIAKYDDTTSLLDATRGVRAAVLLTPTASLSGSTGVFNIAQVSASTYLDVVGNGRSVVALRGLVGKVFGVSNQFTLPPDQRFYAGGSATVRGYRYQSIGPQFRDQKPTGGTTVAAATVEFRQRILDSYGVVAFVDAGQVSAGNSPFSSNVRAGAGIGARYYTSIGPIRLDVAVPLNRLPGGDSFELYIGIGQAF